MKPLAHSPLSVIEEQINRYEVAKQRKIISSKKVTKELGSGLLLLKDFLTELQEYLVLITNELNQEQTALVTPLNAETIPLPSLPTLEVVDSALEFGIIDPDDHSINQPTH